MRVQLDDWPRSLNTKTWMKDWKAPWSPLEAPSASADTLQGPGKPGKADQTREARPRGRHEAKRSGVHLQSKEVSVVSAEFQKRVSKASAQKIERKKRKCKEWEASKSKRWRQLLNGSDPSKHRWNFALRADARPNGSHFLWWPAKAGGLKRRLNPWVGNLRRWS